MLILIYDILIRYSLARHHLWIYPDARPDTEVRLGMGLTMVDTAELNEYLPAKSKIDLKFTLPISVSGHADYVLYPDYLK